MIGKGIPDLITFSRLNKATNELKARMQDVSEEAVTGVLADIPKSIGGRIGEANLIKKALGDIESRTTQYGLVSSRIEAMGAALGNIRNTLDDIGARSLVMFDSPDPTTIGTIATESEIALGSVFSMLNTSHGTRALFGGDLTDQVPLEDVQTLLTDIRAIVASSTDPVALDAALDTYFDDPAGGFQTNMYKGGANTASAVTLANGTRIDYSVKADDKALRDTIRGLAVLAAAESAIMPAGGDDFETFMKAEISNIENGRVGILDSEARLGVSLQALDRAMENDASERQILTAVYQTMVGRDQYEAAAELKQIETQLEASYVLTARLSNLKLVNFIS